MNRKFIKRIFSVVLIAMIVVPLCGCEKRQENEGMNAKNNKEELKGSITISALKNTKEPLYKMASEFMKEHHNVKININYVNNENGLSNSYIMEQVKSSDIVQIEQKYFSAFINEFPNKLLELTEVLEGSKGKKDFSDMAWAQVTSEDSKIYGFPWSVEPCAMYYRKDVFKELGIDPQEIKTWKDYTDIGNKIKKHYNGKKYIAGFNYKDERELTIMLLNQLGAEFYNKNNKINLENEKLLKVVNIKKQMIESGIVMDLKNEWYDRITNIKENKIVTVPYSIAYSKVLENSVKEQSGKWGIMKLPAFEEGGNQSASLGGLVFAINKNTKNRKLAIEFIKFVVMTEKSNDIALQYGMFPAFKPLYKSSIFDKKDNYFNLELNYYFTQLTDIHNQKYGIYFNDVINLINEALYICRTKHVDIKKALDDVSTEFNSKIK